MTRRQIALKRRLRYQYENHALLLWVLFAILFFLFCWNLLPASEPEGLVSPAVDIVVAPTPTPHPQTTKEMMLTLPAGDLVWRTYGHESSWGKHDACKGHGYNGFGWGQRKDGSTPCFSTLEEVSWKVSRFFVTHLKTMTVNQTLCYFNTGKVLNDCAYARYSLAL